MTPKELEFYLSGQVRRYHANPRMARYGQTNADHSWGMLALCLALHPNPSKDLLVAITTHDCKERWVGDMPYPGKKAAPELAKHYEATGDSMAASHGIPCPNLLPAEAKWLEMLDRLESVLYVDITNPDELKQPGWGDLKHNILELARDLGVVHRVAVLLNMELIASTIKADRIDPGGAIVQGEKIKYGTFKSGAIVDGKITTIEGFDIGASMLKL